MARACGSQSKWIANTPIGLPSVLPSARTLAQKVATYCASVRADGKADSKPIGVLAIHFDWEPQARAIVQGVRVSATDKARVLLVDSNFRIIASSDGQGLLTERVPLALEGRRSGFHHERSGALVAFHATPGYETYKGLGWFGVIVGGANQSIFGSD